MKQALVTLNFVVIAVLVTIVAMQNRVDAGPKPVAVGGPIPGMLQSEIPVERKFSFCITSSATTVGPSLSAEVGSGNPVKIFEAQLPSNVGLFLTEVLPFMPVMSSSTTTAHVGVFINGVPAYMGPQVVGYNTMSIGGGTDSFFVPPGSLLRVEFYLVAAVTLQGSYVSSSELSLP